VPGAPPFEFSIRQQPGDPAWTAADPTDPRILPEAGSAFCDLAHPLRRRYCTVAGLRR